MLGAQFQPQQQQQANVGMHAVGMNQGRNMGGGAPAVNSIHYGASLQPGGYPIPPQYQQRLQQMKQEFTELEQQLANTER